MSIYRSKTGVKSILNLESGASRERAKIAAANKVRFAIPKQKGLVESIRGNFHLAQEFTFFLQKSDLKILIILSLHFKGRMGMGMGRIIWLVTTMKLVTLLTQPFHRKRGD